MSTFKKLLTLILVAFFLFLSPMNVKGEALEIIFDSFNKNAARATDILSKGEASNESLSYLRADLFEDRNKALLLQKEINKKYLIQRGELKLIDDLVTQSSIQGTYISLKRQKLIRTLEKTTFQLANTKLSLKRAERLIKEIDALKKGRFNERFFSFNQLVLLPTTYAQGASDFLSLIGNFAVDL